MWRLGTLEAEIMERVWATEEPVPVRAVVDHLNLRRSSPLAYTTVMSTMSRLHRKGWLKRMRYGKQFRYEASASRDVCTAAVMAEALCGSSNPESTLLHFVDHVTESGSPELQAALRRVLGNDV